MGTAGPTDSKLILLGEAPGEKEAEWNKDRQKYGEPFQGKAGWTLKVKLLLAAGLSKVFFPPVGWPRVTGLNAQIINLIMCRPPKNKITSPEGRKAVACCHRSAVAYLQMRDPTVVVPMGGTALKLLTGENAIGVYRGRVMNVEATTIPVMPEQAIIKYALRGIKPPPEWATHQRVIKWMLSFNNKMWKRTWQPKPVKLPKPTLPSEVVPILRVVSALLSKQVRSMKQNLAISAKPTELKSND